MEINGFEIIKLDDTSWRIEDGVVRCFLFEGTDQALLVDCGFGRSDLKGAIHRITEKPLTLVITHADHDHIGGCGQFAPVLVFAGEVDRFQKSAGTDIPVRQLSEGEVIDIGNRQFEVIWLPGHTPGGIALLDREHRVLIAGDNVQTGTIYLAGEGRDVPLYIEGLKKLSAAASACDVIYPSHGPFPTDPGTIESLIHGTESILKGEVEGGPAHPPFDKIAKQYDIGIAKIIC